jgi:transcriptional regulator with XRE-family HTH domain
MLNRKIRDERERLGITQLALSRASGVARSQLAAFEGGANVSVATLERLLHELSTLRLDVVPSTLDLEQARRAAEEVEAHAEQMRLAASRLVAALGGGSATPGAPPHPTPPPAHPLTGGGGAEHHVEPATRVSPQKKAKLERMVDEIQAKKRT